MKQQCFLVRWSKRIQRNNNWAWIPAEQRRTGCRDESTGKTSCWEEFEHLPRVWPWRGSASLELQSKSPNGLFRLKNSSLIFINEFTLYGNDPWFVWMYSVSSTYPSSRLRKTTSNEVLAAGSRTWKVESLKQTRSNLIEVHNFTLSATNEQWKCNDDPEMERMSMDFSLIPLFLTFTFCLQTTLRALKR